MPLGRQPQESRLPQHCWVHSWFTNPNPNRLRRASSMQLAASAAAPRCRCMHPWTIITQVRT